MTRAVAALALLALSCGDSVRPTGPAATGTAPVEITVRLQEGVATFKVVGVLDVLFERLDPPVVGAPVAAIELPAGARSTTMIVPLPLREGRVVLRERTTSPAIPALCGSAGPIDPRVDRAVTVGLALCEPA